jgi:signal transduction histidine kinase/CheY-like chemotaxis protein
VRRTAIVIGAVVLVVLAGLATFGTLEFRTVLSRNLALQGQLLVEQDHVHQISVTISQQAQEWQNILLRSVGPSAYGYHLERFYEKGRELNGHIAALEALLGADPAGRDILERLRAAHRKAALTYRAGLRRIHASAEFPMVAADQAVGDPMEAVNTVARELHGFMDRRSRALIEASTGRTLNSLLTILLAAWVAIVLALVAGLIRFSRSVTRPLDRSIAAAERIASGDLAFTIPADNGGDLGGLLTALETMRARLQRNARDIETVQAGLETQVRDRTVDLQRSEARYKRAARIGHIGYWEWDIDKGEMAACSEELADIYETTVEEVKARGRGDIGMLSWVHADDREEYLHTVARRMNTGHSYVFDLRIVTARGRVRYVRGARDTFTDEAGHQRTIGVLQDVTELRLAQQTSAEARKVEALGRLTGGIAHDMNNLLNIISGNLEMLLESGPDEAGAPALRTAMRATDRGARMTHRLLAFARRQPLAPRPVNLGATLNGFTDLLRSVLSETIAIELVVDGGLWNCEVDVNQLETVLLNLATNARDAMPQGGRLTVEASNARLDEAYVELENGLEPGQYVCISVTDTGVGMPEHVAASAFEPFFTTKKAGEGTGLGLAMAHGFVKQSGGHIRIYSEEGEGTCIRIYLPRTMKGVQKPDGDGLPETGAATAPGPRCILVVEDDADLRSLFTAQIEAMGHIALAAGTGADAVELMTGPHHIDLLLTDVILPGGMSGRDVADAAATCRPGMPVIFMSGYTRNSVIHNGRLDPDVTLLQKPFRKRDLEKALNKAFRAAGSDGAPPEGG